MAAGARNATISRLAAFLRPGESEDALAHIMQTEKVTLPVARNLLKMRTLGVGMNAGPNPRLADERGFPGDRFRKSGGPRLDGEDENDFMERERERKAKARALAKKVQRLQEEEEQEEEARQEKLRRDKRGKISIGISRLGPVMAREEHVDPLPAQKLPEPHAEDDEEDDEDARDQDRVPLDPKERARLVQLQQAAIQAERERLRREREQTQHHDTRKRRLQGVFQAEESEDSADDPKNPKRKDAVPRQKRARSGSPDSESDGRPRGSGGSRGGGGGASSLMSEDQIVAMMKKNKVTGATRGTMRAKERLHREQKEWEIAKQKNSEYWKPPKHCLVVGKAERSQKRAMG